MENPPCEAESGRERMSWARLAAVKGEKWLNSGCFVKVEDSRGILMDWTWDVRERGCLGSCQLEQLEECSCHP